MVDGQSLCVWQTAAASARGEWKSGSTGHGEPSVIHTSHSTMPLLCAVCSATLQQTDPLGLTPLAQGQPILCSPTSIAVVQSSLFLIATTAAPPVLSLSEQECSAQMVSCLFMVCLLFSESYWNVWNIGNFGKCDRSWCIRLWQYVSACVRLSCHVGLCIADIVCTCMQERTSLKPLLLCNCRRVLPWYLKWILFWPLCFPFSCICFCTTYIRRNFDVAVIFCAYYNCIHGHFLFILLFRASPSFA